MHHNVLEKYKIPIIVLNFQSILVDKALIIPNFSDWCIRHNQITRQPVVDMAALTSQQLHNILCTCHSRLEPSTEQSPHYRTSYDIL